MKRQGWTGESHRHACSARGINTNNTSKKTKYMHDDRRPTDKFLLVAETTDHHIHSMYTDNYETLVKTAKRIDTSGLYLKYMRFFNLVNNNWEEILPVHKGRNRAVEVD